MRTLKRPTQPVKKQELPKTKPKNANLSKPKGPTKLTFH